MNVGKDDSSFFSNSIFAALGLAIVLLLGSTVIHAGKNANIVPTQVASR